MSVLKVGVNLSIEVTLVPVMALTSLVATSKRSEDSCSSCLTDSRIGGNDAAELVRVACLTAAEASDWAVGLKRFVCALLMAEVAAYMKISLLSHVNRRVAQSSLRSLTCAARLT